MTRNDPSAVTRNDMEIEAMSNHLEAVHTPADTLHDQLTHTWIKGSLNLRARLRALVADDRGASGIEYALIAAMVAVALAVFVPGINTAVTGIFTSIAAAFP